MGSTFEPDRNFEPQAIGESVQRVTRRLGGSWFVALTKITSIWEEAVGSQVAQHAKPLGVRGKALTVAVDNQGWATQLQFLGSEILSKITELAPGIELDELLVKVQPRAFKNP